MTHPIWSRFLDLTDKLLDAAKGSSTKKTTDTPLLRPEHELEELLHQVHLLGETPQENSVDLSQDVKKLIEEVEAIRKSYHELREESKGIPNDMSLKSIRARMDLVRARISILLELKKN